MQEHAVIVGKAWEKLGFGSHRVLFKTPLRD